MKSSRTVEQEHVSVTDNGFKRGLWFWGKMDKEQIQILPQD